MNSFWQEKQVLVTGAGGFIGSHLVERLADEGANVRAFVRYTSRNDPGLLKLIPAETRAKIQIIGGDLRDSNAIQKAMEGASIVFHLGALISIPYSYRHPREVAETNLMGTLNVLLAGNGLRVERIIHTSTSEVYGTARRVPIDESHPLQGQSPYSASKIGADKLTESFYCTYGLPVVTVRPFNTFGPRQSARAVIPTIITQALAQQAIRLGNTETTRDFTFVDDTVDGFIKAAETKGVEGQTFNLGTGTEIKIGDLAALIIRKVGGISKLEVDAQRLRPENSEVLRLLSDNAAARESLGWSPRVSLDEGLDCTIVWIREHLDLYRVGVYEF
jgi:NAD dependent epimerase/dehydratase